MRIVLLGPPGAGKGTQAKKLAIAADVVHVASGDLFRRHQEDDSQLGRLAKSYMEKGELVPDEVTIRMVLERIHEADAENGYVLDGFPRTLAQAKALDDALEREGSAIDRVPLVEVEYEELMHRLSGRWICGRCQTPYHQDSAPPQKDGFCDLCGGELYQRFDDRQESVQRRLAVYKEHAYPLTSYYQGQGKLRRVNGQQEIEEVALELWEVVKE